MSHRFSLELEDDAAAELHRLAEAEQADPDRYAALLLTHFFRGQRLDSHTATELLGRMPGALEAAREGSAQARRGETIPLDAI